MALTVWWRLLFTDAKAALLLAAKQNVSLLSFFFFFRAHGERQGEAACVCAGSVQLLKRVIEGFSGRLLLLCRLSFRSWAREEPPGSLGSLSASVIHTFF